MNVQHPPAIASRTMVIQTLSPGETRRDSVNITQRHCGQVEHRMNGKKVLQFTVFVTPIIG